MDSTLSDRERAVLRLVVQQFIRTADPVGSRYVAEHAGLGLSAATMRNLLSALEARGLLDHPYTSAGRVPTALGYRVYVDALMDALVLPPSQRQRLATLLSEEADAARVLRESSRLLSRFTSLIGVVLSPSLASGVLDRLEIVPLSDTRVMFVVSIRGGLVRTIMAQLPSALPRRDLDRVVALLNERLAGRRLDDLRRSCAERVRDLDDEIGRGVVRLVLDASATLFGEGDAEHRLEIGGTQNLIAQPEFQEPASLKRLIAMLEDEGTIVQLFEDHAGALPGHAAVRIGREIGGAGDELGDVSLVAARYRLGDTVGTVGVIGPMRMDYARAVAFVEGIAALLDRPGDQTPH